MLLLDIYGHIILFFIFLDSQSYIFFKCM